MSHKSIFLTSSEVSPLLRIDQVAELLRCSTKQVQKLYKAGTLPPRTRVSERAFLPTGTCGLRALISR
jgi:predicted DNA-binding transcriptional regulator AlpA